MDDQRIATRRAHELATRHDTFRTFIPEGWVCLECTAQDLIDVGRPEAVCSGEHHVNPHRSCLMR